LKKRVKVMKNSSKVLLIAPLTLLVSSSLAADTSQVTGQVKQLAVTTVESSINEFANDAANSFGKGNTEVSISNIESGNLNYSIKTIQPLTTLNKDSKSLIFTQGSVASGGNNGDRRTTINLGFGKRILIEDNKAILGANVFYDYETISKHERASLGVEYKRSNFSAAANNYWGLSDEMTIDGVKEQALNGYDVKLSGQVPYTPWATLKGTHYYWDQKLGDDTTGYIVGIEVELSSSAKFEFGVESSNAMNKTAYGKLTFKLQPSGDYKPTNFSFDSTAFRAKEDMDLTALDMVERNNKIVSSGTSISFKGLTYNIVISPDTGRSWLDRNLGASAVCADADGDGIAGAGDEACYGDYYQWGRDDDGHELAPHASTNSTGVIASSITPGTTVFITSSVSPNDWTTVDSDGSLRSAAWGDGGGNDICPIGFRVPTRSELKKDTTTASTVPVTNTATAFSSFLKLPAAGARNSSSGAILLNGSHAVVWSSKPTSNSGKAYPVYIDLGSVSTNSVDRATGVSVRCIND
jgi:uncharacterized protein (TIGR02145 family)